MGLWIPTCSRHMYLAKVYSIVYMLSGALDRPKGNFAVLHVKVRRIKLMRQAKQLRRGAGQKEKQKPKGKQKQQQKERQQKQEKQRQTAKPC